MGFRLDKGIADWLHILFIWALSQYFILQLPILFDRNEIQGLESSVQRSEDGFDAGAKFHVPANVPYIRYLTNFNFFLEVLIHILHFLSRYFNALFYQFQFYKALCQLSGHEGPLNECDFYDSDKLGVFK